MFLDDPTKGIQIAFSSSRSKRPHRPKVCPFCKGNEYLTPPTTLALPSKEWRVRCFQNAFPVVYGKEGRHEVIVETDDHDALLENFSEEQLTLVFQAYQNRFHALHKYGHVFLFKNFGLKSGASIPHEHAQIITFPFMPEIVRKEAKARRVFTKLLKQPTLVENDFFKAVCPPFARFAYEVWILAKDGKKRFEKFSSQEGVALLQLLQIVIRKTKKFSEDYTVAYHNTPWFHVEVYPRKAVWGGIELGTGVIVNFKTAEQALKELRSV